MPQKNYKFVCPKIINNSSLFKKSRVPFKGNFYTAQKLFYCKLLLSSFLNITATCSYILTVPLEGLRSQNQFEEMRSSYIRELIKAIGLRQKGVVSSSQRFYQLTKLLDNLHDVSILFSRIIF